MNDLLVDWVFKGDLLDSEGKIYLKYRDKAKQETFPKILQMHTEHCQGYV